MQPLNAKLEFPPFAFLFLSMSVWQLQAPLALALLTKLKKKTSSKITLVKINSVTYGQRDVAMIADGKPLHGELFFGRKTYFNDLNREVQFINELTKVPQAAK